MSEKNLQSKIILSFGEKCPNDRLRLFSVRNSTFSDRDGTKQKALGMVRGVSDLIYLHEDGTMIGIELKSRGKAHSRSHILQQFIWGEEITRCKGEYYVITSVSGFWNSINAKGVEMPDVYCLGDIKNLLDSGKKTITF